MNILITKVMDKTNCRYMAQLSHIEAQLSLCGRVGPWPMPHEHDQLSHSVLTLHIWQSQLTLYPPLLLKSKS